MDIFSQKMRNVHFFPTKDEKIRFWTFSFGGGVGGGGGDGGGRDGDGGGLWSYRLHLELKSWFQ